MPLAAIGVVPLLAGLTGAIRPLSGLVFALVFLGAGALRATLAYWELAGMRRDADRELRLDAPSYVHSALLEWRTLELTSERHRRAVAASADRVERDVSPNTLPGGSPINRVAARRHLDLFRALSDRLRAFEVSVTPNAVLTVEELLTSADSPLYARERAGELRQALEHCLAVLDDDCQTSADEHLPRAGRS